MTFFIDTADINDIKQANSMGMMKQAAKIGADVATCPLSVLLQLTRHPLTDSGLAKFLKDWDTVPK